MSKSNYYSFSSFIFLFTLSLASINAIAVTKTMSESACEPAIPNTVASHPNLEVMKKLNILNLEKSKSIIAENFIWHYFNPKLPELHGDHHGFEGFKDFFAKLNKKSKGSFEKKVINQHVVGDELVIIQTCNSLVFEGKTIEIDVVVVWRIVDGKIAEGWDIPSIYHARVIKNN